MAIKKVRNVSDHFPTSVGSGCICSKLAFSMARKISMLISSSVASTELGGKLSFEIKALILFNNRSQWDASNSKAMSLSAFFVPFLPTRIIPRQKIKLTDQRQLRSLI